MAQPLNITSFHRAQMLTKEVADQLREYHWYHNFKLYECLKDDSDHGLKGMMPVIPYAPGSYAEVYRGTLENGSYNHHNQFTKFKDTYFYAWSNGIKNEEDAGQRIMISSSKDLKNWSPARVAVGVPEGSQLARNCTAFTADDKRMYLFVMTEETEHDAAAIGMRRIIPESYTLEIYTSEDGIEWKEAYSFGSELKWVFEAPRRTLGGKKICVCCTTHHGAGVLRWRDDNILRDPEIVHIPEPEGASFPYAETSWYQRADGVMVFFWRDEGGSTRMYVNTSEDDGQTFSVPIISDIPDSMSRNFAGQLGDGRYFLVSNTLPNLLDRGALTILTSRDGKLFDKVSMINDDPTAMRRKGLLKELGYQYPCCYSEKDRLIIAYDRNKEDTICHVLDDLSRI